jgi:putative ABC transport system permease protein
VGEVALAGLLLVAAGLLGQALLRLRGVEMGFSIEHVWRYDLVLPDSRYPTPAARLAFFRAHLELVRAIPGISAAGACTTIPLEGLRNNFYEAEGAVPPQSEATPAVLQRYAFPGYFETMGIPLVAGRSFSELDGQNAGAPVVIVDEALARRFWPGGETPIGKHVRMRFQRVRWMEVIGVARDVRQGGADSELTPGLYLPYAAGLHLPPIEESPAGIKFVVRSQLEGAALLLAVREILQGQDAALSAAGFAPLAETVRESLWFREAYSSLILLFGLVALTMATA